MNFNHLEFLPWIVLSAVMIVFTVIYFEVKFFKMVKTYWFYRRSWTSYLASLCFITGISIFLFSLLDARGPEEKIKTEAPTERTIILVDTSASMLAEDVKPSRLQKAILIAKHFARKAAGQQVAVVVFAEIQKKIVPFTNDLDLIDARLDTIKNLKNNYGSSALSVAIQESVQYFRDSNGEVRGNILVLTDGEETADGVKLDIPLNVHVALVGVGTEQGGRIPMDDRQGLRFGYKKSAGKDVITKLNEKFFERTASSLPSAKYWIANSYTLPSDEILEFFRGEIIKGKNQQDMVIKPVLMEWLVLPALAFLIASYFLKMMKVFTLGLILFISPAWSQDQNTEKSEEPKISQETLSKLSQLQNGELSRLEKIKLADDLQKAGSFDEAIQLYQENLPLDKIDHDLPQEAYLNYGTALLQKEKTAEGLKIYDKLLKSSKTPEAKKDLRKTISQNTMAHFRKEDEKKKKEQQDKKENKDQKDQKDQKDKKDQKGSEKDQQKNQKDNGEQGKQDPKNKQGESSDQKDKKDQPEKSDEQKKEDDQKKDEQDKKEDSQGEEKKPLPPRKMPAKLKQLMSDDRQLQMKVIENGTRDLNQKRSRTSKDW